MNINEYRKLYPAYDAVDDVTLSKAVYNKSYKDQMTFKQFASQFGLEQEMTEEGAASTFADEYSKGMFRGFLNVAGGIVGTTEYLIPGEQESLLKMKQRIEATTEQFNPTHEGTAAWSGKVLGEAIPFMATAMAGGLVGRGVAGIAGVSGKLGMMIGSGGVAFAVEGQAAYDAAIASGASESEANTERLLVGTINAYLETLQIDKLLDFGGVAGKHGIQNLVRDVRKRAWKAVGGDISRFTGDVLKLAVTEGLQEATQEGVSVGVPAAIRGEMPRDEDGNPDYYAMLTQIGEAGLGGAFAGTVLGGGSAFYNSTGSIAGPTVKQADETAKKIKSIDLTQTEKNVLLRELDEQVQFDRDSGPTLVSAAIKLKNGEVLTGTTHANIMREQLEAGREITNEEFSGPQGSGFMTSDGRFVKVLDMVEGKLQKTNEAWDIAEAAGQIVRPDHETMTQPEADAAQVFVDNKHLVAESVDFTVKPEKFAPAKMTAAEMLQKKMDTVVTEIEKRRPAEKQEIAKERGMRFSKFRQSMNEIQDPRQRVAMSKRLLAGKLKNVINPLHSKFTDADIDLAFDTITTAKNMTEADVLAAEEGLQKLFFDGQIPAMNELHALKKGNILSAAAIKEILANRTTYQKAMHYIKDLSFAPWALLTSFDVSAGGRQGWKVLFRDPKLWLSSVGRGYRMLMSEDYFKYVELRRKTHPYYQEAIRRGVEETTLDSVTTGEEMMASNMVQKIPGIRGSARAFVGVINELRMGWYFKGREMAEGAGWTAQQQKDLADIANDITGRGKLPRVLEKLQDVGLIFFAPRLTMALLRTPADVITKTGPGRKMLAGALVSFIGFTLSTLYLLDRDDKDDIDVEWSPLSSDFLKVRHGKTRIDITGGYQPLIRAVFQMAYGKRKATESGRVYDVERREIVSRFLQSKLSPHAGLAVDLWKGQTFLGKELELSPAGVGEQLYNRATPLFIQDVADAIRHQGLGMGAVAAPLAFHGLGVQTYPTTQSQDVRALKNRLAFQHFTGSNWDDLGPSAQKAISDAYPQIGLMEEQAKIDRTDYGFIGKILKEADTVGRSIMKSLSSPVREAFAAHTVDVGNIGRNLGSGWYLDDKRYKEYQTKMQVAFQHWMGKLIVHPAWKSASFDVRRELMQELVDEIKKDVRLKTTTQADFKDIRTRQQMKKGM